MTGPVENVPTSPSWNMQTGRSLLALPTLICWSKEYRSPRYPLLDISRLPVSASARSSSACVGLSVVGCLSGP